MVDRLSAINPKQVLNSLQVFRGFGALAVVLHHAVISTDAFVGKVPDVAMAFLRPGYLGVDFFFVLSGFIIMHAHMNDERSTASLSRYAFKRLARIFPAYLPISIALIALYAVLPGLSASGGRDYSLMSSLLLMPADRPPALPVAWTLVHELLFYGVFMTYFASARIFGLALVLWGGAIVSANLTVLSNGWERYPLSVLNIEFMFGVMSAWYVKSLPRHLNPKIFIVVGTIIALSMLILISTQNLLWLSLLFSFGLALIVIGYVLREQSAPLIWPPFLLLMGDASYSIYLTHRPLLSGTQRVAGRFGMDWFSGFLIGVSISLVVGFIYFWLVEKPLTDYFRRRLRKS